MSSPGVNAQASLKASNTNLDEIGYPGLTGTAGGGAASTITLAGTQAIDDFYNGAYIRITGGVGSGQERIISDYDGGTRVATVTPAWDTQPDAASTYTIIGVSGIARAGSSSTTIVLASGESATDDIYIGAVIRINEGTGAGQTSQIIDYVGLTKTATVSPSWATTPDATSVYSIYGEGGTTTSATATTITLTNARSGAADYYNNLYIEITGSTTRDAAIGQVRKITDYATSRVATLEKKWTTTPTGTITYRIIGGWACEYVNVGDASFVQTQLVVLDGESGCRASLFSMTPTGHNASGRAVYHCESTAWGNRYSVISPGIALDTSPMAAQFYRVVLFAFSAFLRGGIKVRFTDSSQTGRAQMDLSATSAPISGQDYRVSLHSGGVAITETSGALDVNVASGSLTGSAGSDASYLSYHNATLVDSGVLISADATTLRYVTAGNTDASAIRYVKLYDKATAPTSTDTPVLTIQLSPQATEHIAAHMTLSNGLGIRATTGSADSDTGAPAAGDVIVDVTYSE